MRDIEKPNDSTAISTNIVVGVPLFIVIVVFSLVVWLVVGLLVERVLDALVEDFFGVVRSIWAFCARNGVMEAEVVEDRWEIIWMVFDIELLIEEVLNLLFFPGLSLTETFDELFLLCFVELRGPAAPKFGVSFLNPP